MTNNTLRRFAYAAAIVAGCLVAAAGCKKNEINVSSGLDDEDPLEGCTALYLGEATSFESTQDSVILYKTPEADTYYAPGFFGTSGGDLNFTWDKTTNVLSMIESWTGLFSGIDPVIAISQDEYDKAMGNDKLTSTYDPVTKTFTFYTICQSGSETGIIQSKQTFSYKITGDAPATTN